MVSEDIYMKVLMHIEDSSRLVSIAEVFENRDFVKIGKAIFEDVLNIIHTIDDNILKEILFIRLNYDSGKFNQPLCDELYNDICKRIIGFKTYPIDEFVLLQEDFAKTKDNYHDIISRFTEEIQSTSDLIRVDKGNPQNCGSLIKQQEKICSRNTKNRSLLKDLKRIEEDYINLEDIIQEHYVYQEMIKYAKNKVETYFLSNPIKMGEEEASRTISYAALKISREDSALKNVYNEFNDYVRLLLSWDNVTKSIYKPFFMIKMRKFHDDIEQFFYENHNGAYWNKTDELLELCKDRDAMIMDSDKWIALKQKDKSIYLSELKKYVTDFEVIKFLHNKMTTLYCIQKRKEILCSVLEAFEKKDYSIFINLVVLQIEGIFYDLFYDANIQKRLDGDFDLFEQDDLRNKFLKNESLGGLEEAIMYFKFYFNNCIRNKIAHGRCCYEAKSVEILSYELLLDLQYVIHLASQKSDTSEAIDYIKHTLRWLTISLSKDNNNENHIYERLLSSLNNNVIRSKKDGITYVNSHQELYWIFNPYYNEAYNFSGVVNEKNKLIDYITSQEFWVYVSNYLSKYPEMKVKRFKIKKEFASRVKALQMYIAKNKKEVLPIVVEVQQMLNGLCLEE